MMSMCLHCICHGCNPLLVLSPEKVTVKESNCSLTSRERATLNFCLLGCSKHFFIFYYWAIGLMSRVFTNGPGDRGSIPGRVILKTKKKMVLDTTLLNTQNYKVKIKGKVEQYNEWSSILPYILV